MLKLKKGVPKAIVSIYTDDKKYVISGTTGDPNSEIISITTTKTLGGPYGSFEIRFVPKNKWFEDIDPHDYVEIQMAGYNEDLTVIMRGLIDTVSKAESWPNGIPEREITISGSDLGKLLTDFGVWWIPALDAVKAITSKMLPWDPSFPLVLSAQGAFAFIFKEFKRKLDLSLGSTKGISIVKLIDKLDFAAASLYPDDETNTFYLVGFEGPFWNAFSKYQDKPFNEMFVYDGPDKSWFIMRPAKLKDAAGGLSTAVEQYGGESGSNVELSYEENYTTHSRRTGKEIEYDKKIKTISGKTLYPSDFSIDSVDKISISVSKNDDEVWTYYFTIPEAPSMMKMDLAGYCIWPYRDNPEKAENPFIQLDSKIQSAYVGKYGIKRLEASTVFLNLGVGENKEEDRGKNYSEEIYKKNVTKTIQRNRTLVAWFLHNEHLLKGTMSIRGTNKAIIGTYVKDNDDQIEYYVEGVSHNFIMFQSYTTNLTLTRGLPFSGQSGYWNKYFFSSEGGNVNAPVNFPTTSSIYEKRG